MSLCLRRHVLEDPLLFNDDVICRVQQTTTKATCEGSIMKLSSPRRFKLRRVKGAVGILSVLQSDGNHRLTGPLVVEELKEGRYTGYVISANIPQKGEEASFLRR